MKEKEMSRFLRKMDDCGNKTANNIQSLIFYTKNNKKYIFNVARYSFYSTYRNVTLKHQYFILHKRRPSELV